MRERKGDWRDVLSAYTIALDAKKLYMGFVATLGTALVMVFSAMVHGALVGQSAVGKMGDLAADQHIFNDWLQGNLNALAAFVPVLNPFAGGMWHFLVSILFYVLLLVVWSFMGAVISRIAALEYGRDELPTLADGVDMARKKYAAYFFAPISPLIGVVFFSLLNALGGLIGSIPYVGPVLMVVGIVPWFISTVIIVFIAVLGVISFSMMYPAISIGGKDAFEGWSSAYSYVLWGFNRFVGYSVVAAIIGILTTVAAWALCEFFIYTLLQTLHYWYIGGQTWVSYAALSGPYYMTEVFMSPADSLLMRGTSGVMLVALLCVRAIPAAYLFSYFFTAGTVICFLMRKHVDRIEIDEVYEEEEEEEFGEMPEEPEAGPAGTAAEEEGTEEAEEEEEPAAEQEPAEETPAEEEETGPEEAPEEKTAEEPEAEAEEEEQEDDEKPEQGA